MNEQNVEQPNTEKNKKRFYRIHEQVWVKPLKVPGEVLNVNTGTKEVTVLVNLVNNDEERTFKLWEITKFRAKRPMIKIKYLVKDLEKIEQNPKSDWIDLRAAKTMEIKAGEHVLIPLGVAMQLPRDHEAIAAPRGSSFKNWGLLQTNPPGVIDNTFQGEDDEWFWSVYATRDTVVNKNDRVCQFRILLSMGEVFIKDVEVLHGVNRGGYGSTGIN